MKIKIGKFGPIEHNGKGMDGWFKTCHADLFMQEEGNDWVCIGSVECDIEANRQVYLGAERWLHQEWLIWSYTAYLTIPCPSLQHHAGEGIHEVYLWGDSTSIPTFHGFTKAGRRFTPAQGRKMLKANLIAAIEEAQC